MKKIVIVVDTALLFKKPSVLFEKYSDKAINLTMVLRNTLCLLGIAESRIVAALIVSP